MAAAEETRIMPQSPSSNAPQTAPVKGGAVAYLTVGGALAAAQLYRRAFDATIAAAHPPDAQGRTMHVHLYINGSSVMLSDAFPEHGHALQTPAGFSVVLMVTDVDAWHRRAIEAGLVSTQAPTDMFWGDRYAALRDSYGVAWGLNGPQVK
jgi:uncharacterized glyoxalase superfamily protein PhnB